MKKYIVAILLIMVFTPFSSAIKSIAQLDPNQEIATNEPDLSYPTQISEGNWFEATGNWQTTENDPIWNGQISITLYVNSSIIGQIYENSATTNTWGNFSFGLGGDVTLRPGAYIWELNFRKSGYQGWDILLEMKVVPVSYNLEIDFLPEMVKGQEFIISVQVTNNDVEPNRRDNSAIGVEVLLHITVQLENGAIVAQFISEFTVPGGLASIRIQPQNNWEEILSISAQVADSESFVEVEEQDLPMLINSPEEPLDERFRATLEKNSILHLMTTLILLSSTIFLLLKRQTTLTKNNTEMWPNDDQKEV